MWNVPIYHPPKKDFFLVPTLVSSAIKADSVLRQQWPRGMCSKVSLATGYHPPKMAPKESKHFGPKNCIDTPPSHNHDSTMSTIQLAPTSYSLKLLLACGPSQIHPQSCPAQDDKSK